LRQPYAKNLKKQKNHHVFANHQTLDGFPIASRLRYICRMEQRTGQQKRGWILAALMMTMTLAAMDITIVSTAIPQIVADLGGFTKFSWVFSIYLLAQTVTIPLY